MSKILNCGKAKSRDELIRFSYFCPQKWESLPAPDNELVHLCRECRENIIYCTSKEQAEASVSQGNCITLDKSTIIEVNFQFYKSSQKWLKKSKPNHTTLYQSTKRAWGKYIFDRQKQQLVKAIRDQLRCYMEYNHGFKLDNFNYQDLSNLDLGGVDLSHLNLIGVDLTNTNLGNANLSHSNLSYADLSHANLANSNLSHSNLSYADLSHANLTDSNLTAINISGTNLDNADLTKANLSGVDLDEFLTHQISLLAKNSYPWQTKVKLDQAFMERKDRARYLYIKAKFLVSSVNYGRRLKYLEQALAIVREIGDRSYELLILPELARINHGHAWISYGQESKLKAFRYLEQALSIVREIGDRQQEAKVFYEFGCLYLNLVEKRWITYNCNSVWFKFLKIFDYEAKQQRLEDRTKGIAYLQQALLIAREIKDCSQEAMILDEFSFFHLNQGEEEPAFEYYQAAFAIYKQLNDDQSLRRLLALTTFRCAELEVYNYQNKLFLVQKDGSWLRELEMLNQLGNLYLKLGDQQQALKYLAQILTPVNSPESLGGLKSCYQNQILALETIVQICQSLDCDRNLLKNYQQLLTTWRARNNYLLQVVWAAQKGDRYLVRDKVYQALGYYNLALLFAEMMANKLATSIIYCSIAKVYEKIGEPVQAINFYHQAVAIKEELEDCQRAAKIRKTIEQLSHDYAIRTG